MSSLSDLPGAGSHAHRDHRPYPSPQTLAKYRLTRDAWRALWDGQGGRCGICGKPPRTLLVIDHDHRSGRVRGLLCPLCNGKLGKVRDDVEWLRSAADYLEMPPARDLLTEVPTARTLNPSRRRRTTRR